MYQVILLNLLTVSSLLIFLKTQVLKTRLVIPKFDVAFFIILLFSTFAFCETRFSNQKNKSDITLDQDFPLNGDELSKNSGPYIICKSCDYKNSIEDRYCLNCASSIYDLNQQQIQKLKIQNKELIAKRRRDYKNVIDFQKLQSLKSRRFLHYDQVLEKLNDLRHKKEVSKREIEILVNIIEKVYFFKVNFEFPSANSSSNPSYKQSNLKRIVDMFIVLEDFFRFYPLKVFNNELKSVNIVSDLRRSQGQLVAGLAKRKVFWISTGAGSRKYPKREYLKTLHHEFAHILHMNHRFPLRKWNKCNQRGFKYVGYKAHFNSKASYRAGHKIYEKGFISRYAMTRDLEDIAELAEAVITQSEKSARIIKKYPILLKKYDILRKFYLKRGVDLGVV